MNFRIFLATGIIFAIFLAGCAQPSFDSEITKINELQQRYSLEEQLAPARLEDLNAFKAELNMMKQKTKDSAFSSFLDIKINAAETIELISLADLELRRINTANIDCRQNAPLAKAVSLLDRAVKKADSTKTRIAAFTENYPQFAGTIEKTGLGDTRINDLKKSLKDQSDSIKTLWLESC